MPIDRTYYENLLLEDLAGAIEAGEVEIIEDSESFYRCLVDAFPTQMNRIKWAAVPDACILEAPPPGTMGGFTLIEPATELRAFWERMRRSRGIRDDMEVVVLGDSLVEFALRLSVATFTRHSVDILSIPHHTFVLPEDVGWCFNYTMEGDAFFGARPADLGEGRSAVAKSPDRR